MNPEKALTFQIRTLGNLIERKMNYIIAKNVHDDITPMHSMILAYLHRNEGHDIYQKDIESRFDITRRFNIKLFLNHIVLYRTVLCQTKWKEDFYDPHTYFSDPAV